MRSEKGLIKKVGSCKTNGLWFKKDVCRKQGRGNNEFRYFKCEVKKSEGKGGWTKMVV